MRYRSLRLILPGHTTLTFRQVAIHQAVPILREIGILQAKRVAHLVHDRRKQVHATSRGARRIRVASGYRNDLGELCVAHRRRIDKPATTASIAIEFKITIVRLTEI